MRNLLTLYHESTEIAEQPVSGKGKTSNDYGRGFYCTEDKEAAMEWACSKNSDGYCKRYTIDTDDLDILDLNSLPAVPWFAVLVSNRHVTLVDDVRTFIYEHAIPRPMQRCTVLILTALTGFILMAAGFAGYLSNDADAWTWLFAAGAVVLAASYIMITRGSKKADAELDALYDEQAMEGYVYYMDGEPYEMEATITDLTRRP